MNTSNHVELLAPAGNLSCALAAFDAGADAVYAGLKKFNARERTENFSRDEMAKLIAYAHKNNRRVYVTFNTLIKEDELESAASQLADMEQLRPDALIVQDLGIVRLIREYFPKLTIHASTQMGLHNSVGLAFAKELGISRVILERQTTLPEIHAILKKKPPEIEIEMFIHGALCCSISGTCLLSSWLGGWSGNRGKCKQPCRRRYHSDSGNGFFLSSQDLCTIEKIPEIIASGVKSLKIEGRLRRADYVQNAVAAYRMAVDAAEDEQKFKEIIPEAKELLTKTCGRKWSLGYYTEQSRQELMKFDSLGASGLLCGKVIATAKNGFTVALSRRIHIGDVVRVQPRSGDEGPAVTITKMSVAGKAVSRALKDETLFIHSDKPVAIQSLVFKTGESVGDYSKRIDSLPAQKTLLDMNIHLSKTFLACSVCGKSFQLPLDLSEANSRPLTPEMLKNEFEQLSTPDFSTGFVTAKITGNPFLPASILKSIRKECSQWISEHISVDDVLKNNRKNLDEFIRHHQEETGHIPKTKYPDCAAVPRKKRLSLPQGTLIVREINDVPSPHEELLLPFSIRENDIPRISGAIRDFAQKGGKCVRITAVYQLALLKDYPQLAVKTCMPLPICNSMTVEELKAHNVSVAQAWIELGKKELEALADKSNLPLELYTYGRPVLLSTYAKIPADGAITDSRGNTFFLSKNGKMTSITAQKVMSIPPIRGFSCSFADYRNADPNEKQTAIFNFECGLS